MLKTQANTMRVTKLLTIAVLSCCFTAPGMMSGADPVPMPLEGALLRFTFGLKDSEATAWDGKLTLSTGAVVELQAAQRQQTSVQGSSWKMSSRKRQGIRRRGQMLRPSLRAHLDAPAAAAVAVTTAQGKFSFRLGDLALGESRTFLAERVRVEGSARARAKLCPARAGRAV